MFKVIVGIATILIVIACVGCQAQAQNAPSYNVQMTQCQETTNGGITEYYSEGC